MKVSVHPEIEKAAGWRPTAQNVDLPAEYRPPIGVSRARWLKQAQLVLAGLIINLELAVHLSYEDQQVGWAVFESLLDRYVTEKHRGQR